MILKVFPRGKRAVPIQRVSVYEVNSDVYLVSLKTKTSFSFRYFLHECATSHRLDIWLKSSECIPTLIRLTSPGKGFVVTGTLKTEDSLLVTLIRKIAIKTSVCVARYQPQN